jgi:hypothetical protein
MQVGLTDLLRSYALNDSTNIQIVQQAAKARKDSFTSSNPLALGVGSSAVGSRGTGMQTPLGWLTTKISGVAAR